MLAGPGEAMLAEAHVKRRRAVLVLPPTPHVRYAQDL